MFEDLASIQEVFRVLLRFGGSSPSSVDLGVFFPLGLSPFLGCCLDLPLPVLGLAGSSFWLGGAEARALRKMVLGGMKIYGMFKLKVFLRTDIFEYKGQDFLSLTSSINAREDLC